ncbi:hypothetical protein NKG94_14435 [Micromonospora sp. M12]
MTRSDWLNLNGEWQLRQSVTDDAPQFGTDLPERVNVPFPVESALSGIQRAANDNRNYLFYRRTVTIPANWSGGGHCCTSAPSTGRAPSGSTGSGSVRTPAATTPSPST